ncbi:interleukin-10 [Lampris incognitus]|uniref:interleukin-10 n=1 Tax=Lampris incognitus TaxID=2546036 RepID=UPI0024B5D033|nr:interleukin-10 [Lampris incognitus]
MTPVSLLISLLAVLSLGGFKAWGRAMCNNQCCSFLEGFPVRLRRLREDFSQIRGYYEANDELETALLDQTVENYFNSQYGCHAMSSILGFYLRTVLPTAKAGVTDDIKGFTTHMESIEQIFDQLKRDITKCKHYFSCETPFSIQDFNSTYAQMENRGLYKAMSELGLFFNYIEVYLASKRRRD